MFYAIVLSWRLLSWDGLCEGLSLAYHFTQSSSVFLYTSSDKVTSGLPESCKEGNKFPVIPYLVFPLLAYYRTTIGSGKLRSTLLFGVHQSSPNWNSPRHPEGKRKGHLVNKNLTSPVRLKNTGSTRSPPRDHRSRKQWSREEHLCPAELPGEDSCMYCLDILQRALIVQLSWAVTHDKVGVQRHSCLWAAHTLLRDPNKLLRLPNWLH